MYIAKPSVFAQKAHFIGFLAASSPKCIEDRPRVGKWFVDALFCRFSFVCIAWLWQFSLRIVFETASIDPIIPCF
jgi:hypothetical protein